MKPYEKSSSTGNLFTSKARESASEVQGKYALLAQSGFASSETSPQSRAVGQKAVGTSQAANKNGGMNGESASESAADTPRAGHQQADPNGARANPVHYPVEGDAERSGVNVLVHRKPSLTSSSAGGHTESEGGRDGAEHHGGGPSTAPDRRNDRIKDEAVRWARQAGFTQEQLMELGHLMSMVASSHIEPRTLSAMVPIDRGMFGTIFRSTFEGQQVAIKRLGDSTPASFRQKMRELLLELRVLTRISHPNIVHFHGTAADFVQLQDGGPYVGLVFSLCDRGSLDKALFQDKNLTVPQKLSITRQMSEALTYMHCKRVVHRDLNTKNVLLTADCTAQIADFGCARHMTQDVLRTTTISGSPAYMSPEQITGEPLTLAVDVWAFSIILWEVMMDQKPWEGVIADFNQLRHAIVRGQTLVTPHTHRSFPPSYLNAIRIGMKTKATERPKMAALRQELTNAMVFYKPTSKAEEAEVDTLRHKMMKEQDELIKQYVQQQASRPGGAAGGVVGGAATEAGAAGGREMQAGVQQLGAWSPQQSEGASVAQYNRYGNAEDEDEVKKRTGFKGFLKNLCFLV